MGRFVNPDNSAFHVALNQYDVIHLDMQWCMMDAGMPERSNEPWLN